MSVKSSMDQLGEILDENQIAQLIKCLHIVCEIGHGEVRLKVKRNEVYYIQPAPEWNIKSDNTRKIEVFNDPDP